jgi:hypothetical protein
MSLVQTARHLAIEAEEALGVMDVDTRLVQGLADVERLQAGQFLSPIGDQVGDREQHRSTLAWR